MTDSNQFRTVFYGTSEIIKSKLENMTDDIVLSVTDKPFKFLRNLSDVDLIIYEITNKLIDTTLINNIREELEKNSVVLIIINTQNKTSDYLHFGAHDIYDIDFDINDLITRVRFLHMNLSALNIPKREDVHVFKLPFWKRTFDIIASMLILVLLSPVYFIIALLIKIESRGKALIKYPRVGTGYRIFESIYFRTTQSDSHPIGENNPGNNINKTTTIGKILQKTGLDTLPQFLNVLKGDLSIIGNKPLPLSEAELVTTDDLSQRFLAPIGVTGLWKSIDKQTDKHSLKENLKNTENKYAEKITFWIDMKILFRTFF